MVFLELQILLLTCVAEGTRLIMKVMLCSAQLSFVCVALLVMGMDFLARRVERRLFEKRNRLLTKPGVPERGMVETLWDQLDAGRQLAAKAETEKEQQGDGGVRVEEVGDDSDEMPDLDERPASRQPLAIEMQPKPQKQLRKSAKKIRSNNRRGHQQTAGAPGAKGGRSEYSDLEEACRRKILSRGRGYGDRSLATATGTMQLPDLLDASD